MESTPSFIKSSTFSIRRDRLAPLSGLCSTIDLDKESPKFLIRGETNNLISGNDIRGMSIGEAGGEENAQAFGREGPTAMIVFLLYCGF
jgi:hypothetical protein